MYLFREGGKQTTVVFELVDTSGANALTGATFAAGDCKISVSGGATANTTNLPTEIGNGLYKITVTAAEFTGPVAISLVDQTATKVWLDKFIFIDPWNDSEAIPFDFTRAGQITDHSLFGIMDSAVSPTTTTFTVDQTVSAEFATVLTSGVLNGRSGIISTGSLKGRGFFINTHTISGNIHSFTIDVLPATPAAGQAFFILP